MSQLETDCFRLGRHAMFEAVRANLPQERDTAQNLIECKDDMLFAWNAVECSVLCVNWRAAYAKDGQTVSFQTLVPTAPQVFTVDKITASNEGTFLALSGSRGVAIMELPRRWGPNGQYQAGKERIYCSTHNLDERFFINNSGLEIRQLRWHPASPKDSHLLVLLSNNTIRLYEEQSLRTVWRIGPVPSVSPHSGAATPFLGALGDTAVDFDIGPPRAVGVPSVARGDDSLLNASAANSTIGSPGPASNPDSVSRRRSRAARVEWPLLLVRGNGQVYVVLIGIDTEKPQIQGPLRISPATPGNYGLDYCGVLVLPTQPPTLVLAETNGNLHHGILLDADDELDADCASSAATVDASLRVWPAEWSLHIVETVRLELGLADANAAHVIDHCAIHLRRDLANDARYFAHHETGLHAVTVEYAAELLRYAEQPADDGVPFDGDSLLGRSSHAEYLVCTKALHGARPNAVLGFALLQSPSGLLLLLASGQLLSLNLIADATALREHSAASAMRARSLAAPAPNDADGQSFERHVRSMLAAPVTQPILQTAAGVEPGAKESLELLSHATQVLREQYFMRQDRVRQAIEKRVKLLRLMREQQRGDIEQLQRDKERIRAMAERLAERYEDIEEKQLAIFRRAQDVARQVTAANPQSAAAETEFKQQIEHIGAVAKRLAGNIGLARRRMASQDVQLGQFQGTQRTQTKAMVLQPRMESTIRGLLSEINTEIETQVKEVNNIRAHANLA